MEFKTTDFELFTKMVAKAIEHGLTFCATEFNGTYFIEYTGGY